MEAIQSRSSGEQELLRQRDDLASGPARSRFWSAQRERPLGLGEQPEIQLWAAKMRLEAAGIRHLGDLLMVGRKAKGIQGERCRLVFDFERVLVDPHTDLFPGKSIFAKEAPVPETDIAVFVEMARKLCGIEHPREHLFRVGSSQDTAQHLGGAVSPVLAL